MESVLLPDAKTPGSYRGELVVPTGVSVRDAARRVELVDKAGAVIGSYQGGFAHDASLVGLPTAVSVRTVSQTGAVALLEVAIADTGWLAAPERILPATIDPVFEQETTPGAGGRDLQVIGGAYSNTNYSGLTANQAGIYQGAPYRSLLGFDVSSSGGATVTDAGVFLYSVYTGFVYSCTGKPLSVYALGAAFTEATTWATQLAVSGAALNTVSPPALPERRWHQLPPQLGE